MILVTGAGGKTGRALVKALSKVEDVRAWVYHEGHVSILRSLGAKEVFVGDMRHEPAMMSAMGSVRSIYHICPNINPEEVLIGELVISEARKAGVEHFVYHSVLHPQTQKMNHHWQKSRVEEMIFESGLPFTILQPAPYMQNLLAGWRSIIEVGVLRVPYSIDSKFSFVDVEDVGAAAATVLSQPDHINATYEIVGTQPISHAEVAKIFGGALNRDVRAEKERIADWRVRTDITDQYAVQNLIGMFEYYDSWGLAGNPIVLGWLLRREPVSLESFVQRIVKERATVG